jgi:protoporphyrinogen oxidase/predicted dehydrogenase
MRERTTIEPELGHAPVRIGVVGLGYWGPNLARNVAEARTAELAYLCDLRHQAIEPLARRYPAARATSNFAELLADPELDAIAIATPVSTHAELAAAALDAGKHVFVEKPLASSTADAVALRELAQQRGRVLMPGHTFLYSPPVVKIKELIDAGELGDIYFVSMSRVNLGLHQPDVSVVWDLGPHDFSILRYWLGELPTTVSATSRSCVIDGVPDVAFVNLTYASGAIAHVELSWLAPSKLRRTAIVGSKKMVVYDDTSAESVRIFDSGAEVPDPDTFGEYRLTYRTGEIVSPQIDATEPLALQLEAFCRSVTEAAELRSSPDMGVDVVRVVEAVDRSLDEKGMPVSVAEVDALDFELALAELMAAIPGRPPAPAEEAESIGTAVLGAGPAGLSAAYALALHGRSARVYEADGSPGGIAKTVEFNGFRFDLGGHRFFTKLKPIEHLWEEMIGDDFLTRPRLSRIYYRGRFFAYPLQAKDVVARLGLRESVLCTLSYLAARSSKRAESAASFEEWVTARFGRRLYDAFFRSYSEKVWGIPGSEIRSLWAAQRIKNFSLGTAVLAILGLRRKHVTTLIEEFRYPRLGPGQMWERFQQRIEQAGVPVVLKHRCNSIKHADGRITSIVLRSNGDVIEEPVDGLISTLPLSDLVASLDPEPPEEVLAAADRLRYRDLCLVALMLDDEQPFPDNWIYLHDPDTRAGRVQNFGAWSDAMVQPGKACLGVEYFCFEGDDIWEMSDEEAVELAKSELGRIGLIDPARVFDGVKVRVPKAYPMYDTEYEAAVATIKAYLAGFENFETCGRNGLHRYNNQDHSMATGILAAANLIGGHRHDVWSFSGEEEYLEQGEAEDAPSIVQILQGEAAPIAAAG